MRLCLIYFHMRAIRACDCVRMLVMYRHIVVSLNRIGELPFLLHCKLCECGKNHLSPLHAIRKKPRWKFMRATLQNMLLSIYPNHR